MTIFEIAFVGTYTSWVVSGVILVWSIWKIKNFLKSRYDDEERHLNQQDWLHALAFGLFALGVLIYEAFYLVSLTAKFASPDNS